MPGGSFDAYESMATSAASSSSGRPSASSSSMSKNPLPEPLTHDCLREILREVHVGTRRAIESCLQSYKKRHMSQDDIVSFLRSISNQSSALQRMFLEHDRTSHATMHVESEEEPMPYQDDEDMQPSGPPVFMSTEMPSAIMQGPAPSVTDTTANMALYGHRYPMPSHLQYNLPPSSSMAMSLPAAKSMPSWEELQHKTQAAEPQGMEVMPQEEAGGMVEDGCNEEVDECEAEGGGCEEEAPGGAEGPADAAEGPADAEAPAGTADAPAVKKPRRTRRMKPPTPPTPEEEKMMATYSARRVPEIERRKLCATKTVVDALGEGSTALAMKKGFLRFTLTELSSKLDSSGKNLLMRGLKAFNARSLQPDALANHIQAMVDARQLAIPLRFPRAGTDAPSSTRKSPDISSHLPDHGMPMERSSQAQRPPPSVLAAKHTAPPLHAGLPPQPPHHHHPFNVNRQAVPQWQGPGGHALSHGRFGTPPPSDAFAMHTHHMMGPCPTRGGEAGAGGVDAAGVKRKRAGSGVMSSVG
eukprot:CAMPEP_0181292994 /NCGR_PEP_ID=MMETSP1101-20121128/2818_1 /TAXON_ID=46948 /ORGANISM="Rhodomonas abbreviata, Strain Caron Lab Isolate" /LENGTH=527 /DNA_ID=CAMNT_0023397531 /DNA_START=97 /DNA_END=1676 /DNA_ORIENTATION=+